MPKGNWMYGDNLDKEGKGMSKEEPDFNIKAPDIEWTQGNTIGDPLGMDTKRTTDGIVSSIKSILYSVFVTYMWLCTMTVTGAIIYVLRG